MSKTISWILLAVGILASQVYAQDYENVNEGYNESSYNQNANQFMDKLDQGVEGTWLEFPINRLTREGRKIINNNNDYDNNDYGRYDRDNETKTKCFYGSLCTAPK